MILSINLTEINRKRVQQYDQVSFQGSLDFSLFKNKIPEYP